MLESTLSLKMNERVPEKELAQEVEEDKRDGQDNKSLQQTP
jgi:hypothetical protein